MRTLSSAPWGKAWSASARCASAAATTASVARVKEKKKASPWVSTSTPPVGAKRLAQELAVLREDLAVGLAQGLEQVGRALDVVEHQGDRSLGQLSHRPPRDASSPGLFPPAVAGSVGKLTPNCRLPDSAFGKQGSQ